MKNIKGIVLLKRTRVCAIFLCFVLAACTMLQGCLRDEPNVCDVTFWHSYTGEQAAFLSMLTDTYNVTEGKHRSVNIVLEYKSDDDIESDLLERFDGQDRDDYPAISVSGGELAYKAMTRGLIVPAEQYLTYDELSGYFTGFISEGRITGGDETYIFPISKSSEITIVNDSAWRYFSNDCNADIEKLSKWNGITDIARQYYEWSGGRAFIALESAQNYIFTYSAQQLPAIIQAGNKEIKINTNKKTLRDIWDFYYGGVVRGYILQTVDIAESLENGDIICYVGMPRDSESFPRQFKNNSGGINTLLLSALPYPAVSTSRNIAPQGGKGVVVFDHGSDMNSAAFEFIHWLCSHENAVEFSAENSEIAPYANNYTKTSVNDYMRGLMLSDYTKYSMLSVSVNQAFDGSTYAPTAFVGYESFCEELTSSLIDSAANGRARMLQMINDGASYDEAVESIDTDDIFEEWYRFVAELAVKY